MPMVSSLTCPNVKDIGCLNPCCKSAALERDEFSRRMPPARVRPSSGVYNIKENKMSKNVILRSHYCPEELKNPEYGRRVSRSCSASTQLRAEGEGGRGSDTSCECDVTFVRKLLALNKKEEMLLNKKLAKLLREKQFGMSVDRHLPRDGCNSTSAPNFVGKKGGLLNEKMLTSDELPLEPKVTERSSKPTEKAPHPKPQLNNNYDLNGRRIYQITDDEEEDEQDSISQLEKFQRGRSWVNSISIMKYNPDCNSTSRSKISSERKHSTGKVEAGSITRPAVGVQKVSHNSGSGEDADEEDDFHLPFLRSAERIKSDLRGSWSGAQATSQGDGVQNVVVHCSKVDKGGLDDAQDKHVLKVWNFNNIPKIKSGDRILEMDNLRNGARLDERLQDSKGNNDGKTAKDNRSKQKTSKTQSSRKIKNSQH